MEIISVPCETPGGGLLDFQNRFLPLLQKLGRKLFLKLSSPTRCQNDYGLRIPALFHPLQRIRNADPWSHNFHGL
jgi:hypothetical protein